MKKMRTPVSLHQYIEVFTLNIYFWTAHAAHELGHPYILKDIQQLELVTWDVFLHQEDCPSAGDISRDRTCQDNQQGGGQYEGDQKRQNKSDAQTDGSQGLSKDELDGERQNAVQRCIPGGDHHPGRDVGGDEDDSDRQRDAQRQQRNDVRQFCAGEDQDIERDKASDEQIDGEQQIALQPSVTDSGKEDREQRRTPVTSPVKHETQQASDPQRDGDDQEKEQSAQQVGDQRAEPGFEILAPFPLHYRPALNSKPVIQKRTKINKYQTSDKSCMAYQPRGNQQELLSTV